MLQGVSACTACPPQQFRPCSPLQRKLMLLLQPQHQSCSVGMYLYCKHAMLHAYFRGTLTLLACNIKALEWKEVRFRLVTPDLIVSSAPICLLSFPLYNPTPLPSLRASLWSSCVVLPLLALTWMSAVLAMTDKRSILFQILFAVFDSLQGFVIVMVHCVLRREVEDD